MKSVNFVRAIVLAVIINAFGVNPVIKEVFFQDLVKFEAAEKFQTCIDDTNMSYECFGIM